MISMRTIFWLALGIVAVVAAHLALDVRDDRAPSVLQRRVLVPEASRATSFAFARTNAPVTRLAATDGRWKIVAPYVADVDSAALLRLSDTFAYAPIDDEMTDVELLRIGRTRQDFGLVSPRLVVTVGGVAHRHPIDVSFGDSTPAGDGVYATIGDGDTVYVVSSNAFAAIDRQTAEFRRRRFFSASADAIASFDIRCGTGRFARLVRENDAWKLVEPREGGASAQRVRRFLDALLGIEAKSFVWPSATSNETMVASASLLAGYGLDDESSVSVTVKTASGESGRVAFGREVEKGDLYALMPGGVAVVTVPTLVRDLAVAGMNAFVDPRIFPLEASAVNVVSLDDGERACLLSRGAGGSWRLDSPVSSPADPIAVSTLIARLLALRSSDVVTNGVRVSIGTNAEPVAVSSASVLADFRLEDLRAKKILKIASDQIKRIVVTDRGQKQISVLRDADKGVWSVESAEKPVSVENGAIKNLTVALDPLDSIRVVKLKVSLAELGAYGLAEPTRTLAIDQMAADSVRRNILVGDMTDDGCYVTLGSADAVFVVSHATAAALLAPIAK